MLAAANIYAHLHGLWSRTENLASGLRSKTARLDRVLARGKPSPIPIFPGKSQVHSHAIPMRRGHPGPEEMKLDNQTTPVWKVGRVDFAGCGPRQRTNANAPR